MQVSVRAALDYSVAAPSSFVFNIAAASTGRQDILQETLRIEPDGVEAVESPGVHGDNRLLRVEAPPGDFRIVYEAQVALSPQIALARDLTQTTFSQLPNGALTYLNPSRYCPSDTVARWALREFGATPEGAGRVRAICDWIADRMEYLPGTTDERTDAVAALVQCAGVCRDYAHIGIAFCRAMGIPARYVSGYAVDLDPPDFHGCFEVYLGGRWYLFDATKMAPKERFVRIGFGRDAADCAFATIVGPAQLTSIDVSAEYLSGHECGRDDAAISTA